jgi:cysteine synthase
MRQRGIRLPTLSELAEPGRIQPATAAAVRRVSANAIDPLNLFRIHWYNRRDGSISTVPDHLVLGSELTGVRAPIVVLLADRFPLIGAHKVLPAYAALAARLVAGQFDPATDRAVWPSTGNYCRGGIAISRLLGCRGVAVLPEGMSRERFDWLDAWVADAADIVRTLGSESNVKEIYDKCRELAAEPGTIVLNQFAEFTNYLAHYHCTGQAAARAFERFRAVVPTARLRAFVAATGSSGSLAAGDLLKERYGSAIVAAEALECPTMLRNGFGEHNIQGIGDKHIPLIHNVMNMDAVVAISDEATDDLNVVFNSGIGRDYLRTRLGVDQRILGELGSLGLSSICNILAAIRLAGASAWGPDEVVLTVATDGALLYESERRRRETTRFAGRLNEAAVARALATHVGGGELLELGSADRERIFNLGYYTWVEQQGISLESFVARREPLFWARVQSSLEPLDEMIVDFNRLSARGAPGPG